MAAIMLRGLDDAEFARLKQEARTRGVSVNALLKQLVREGLGLAQPARGQRFTDLDALGGTWDADEADSFERAVEPFERIEPELWR